MATPKRAVTQFCIEFETDGDNNIALTSHFSTMRIINSTRSIWPIFYLYFYVDNQIFIEKNIYGVSDITCKIYYTDNSGVKKDPPITYKLLYLEAKVDLPPKEEKNGTIEDQKEMQRRHIIVTCLAKPAYLAMTTFVNKLWEDSDGKSGTGKTPLDIVKDILDYAGMTGNTRMILEDGQNKNTIQQMLVPPMTVRASIDYINQNYGIFSGPTFRYANYSGQFLLWDLKQLYDKHKEAPWVKFHKSPSHFSTPGMFQYINDQASNTNNEFVTYDLSESIHHANANVIRYGYYNVYIYHPHEDIAIFQKKNLDEINKKYGIFHDSNVMKYNKDLQNRKLYYTDMNGFETGDGYSGNYSDEILTQDMSTSFQSAAEVRLVLYRNVKIHMVQKVGEVMYFKPYSDFEGYKGSNYEGGYLISDSEIVLTREQNGNQQDNVNCITTLTAYRTAQSKD